MSTTLRHQSLLLHMIAIVDISAGMGVLGKRYMGGLDLKS
jgi:hypothetical protein